MGKSDFLDQLLSGVICFLVITIVPTVVMVACASFFSSVGPEVPEGEPTRWYDVAYGVFALLCIGTVTIVVTIALQRWMQKSSHLRSK